MTSVLQIEGDPASWALDANSPADVIQQALISRGGPITVNVAAPLKGRLILSTRSVTSVAVLTAPAGWIPGGAIQLRATLYVPSPTGPTTASHGYTLQPSADLASLESDIVTALTDGTTIAIPVADGEFAGSLLLNGGTIPFVVLCSPAAR
jgi:hypothetical protein